MDIFCQIRAYFISNRTRTTTECYEKFKAREKKKNKYIERLISQKNIIHVSYGELNDQKVRVNRGVLVGIVSLTIFVNDSSLLKSKDFESCTNLKLIR